MFTQRLSIGMVSHVRLGSPDLLKNRAEQSPGAA
jgi:hypothetical protein